MLGDVFDVGLDPPLAHAPANTVAIASATMSFEYFTLDRTSDSNK
jgi:hypothetical protein